MVEEEILLAGDPNKEILASKFVERLIGRFRGEIQDELGDLIICFVIILMKRCVQVSIA